MNTGWQKSSYSGSGGNECVEVSFDRKSVHMRDSKNPDGPQLHLSRRAWLVFLDAVKDGRFDAEDPDESITGSPSRH